MAKKGGSRKRVQEEEGESGACQPVMSAGCGSTAQQQTPCPSSTPNSQGDRETFKESATSRKRGRPRKLENLAEEFEHSGHLTTTICGNSVPQQVLACVTTTPDQAHKSPVSSRYPTRNSRTLLAQCALVAFSRYPIRNVKGIPNQSSTSTPMRTGLVETTDQSTPTSNNFTLRVPPELQTQNSAAGPSRRPIRPEKSTPSMENLISCDKQMENSKSSNNFSYPTSADLMDADNFANQFLSANQGNEDLPIPPPPSAAPNIASQLHMAPRNTNMAFTGIENGIQGSGINGVEREGCSGQAFSLDYTQIAEMLDEDDEVASAVDPALVTVNGYRVKEEVAPLLRSIILKYGDIAKNSSLKSVRIRSTQLEIVCAIYRNLEKIKPTEITTWEIKRILADVADLETVKLDLGWLRQRLEEISEALQYTKGYTTLKKEKTEKTLQAETHKNELEELKSKVAAIEADIEKIDKTIMCTRSKMHLLKQPLVAGLL